MRSRHRNGGLSQFELRLIRKEADGWWRQGVKQVKKTQLNARFLFLSPPSIQILEQRLRGRGTDSEDAVQKRLKQAEAEMSFAKEEGIHDKVVINDELDRAYKEVESWIVDEDRYGS